MNPVAKVMAEKELVARRRHRRRSTTRSDRSARKAPDAVNRDFTPPERPDVTWCGDLTEIPTEEGTTLADLFGRCDPGLPGLPLAISMPPTLWSPMPRVLTPGRQ